MSYPFLIEPRTSLHLQAYAWSGVYALFALLCAASAFYFFRHAQALPAEASAPSHKHESGSKPHTRDYLSWLGLSAIGSWLLVAITNHITQNIATIPFLWLLPLTIYLLTFVLCFESDRWYVRSRFLIPTAVFLATCAYGLGSMIGYDVKV